MYLPVSVLMDRESNKTVDDDSELHDSIWFDNSGLQQDAFGNGKRQDDEAIDAESLKGENLQHGLVNESNAVLHLGFPFTGLAEATSIHINSIIKSRNSLQLQETPLNTRMGLEAQQSFLLEFDNYANQILGRKQQTLPTTNNNIAAEMGNDIVGTFAVPCKAVKTDSQQMVDDEVTSTVYSVINSRSNEVERIDTTMSTNSSNGDSGNQKSERCEPVASITSSKENTPHRYPVGELISKSNGNLFLEEFTTHIASNGRHQFTDGSETDSSGNAANNFANDHHLPAKHAELKEIQGNQSVKLRAIPGTNEGSQKTSFKTEIPVSLHHEELAPAKFNSHSILGVSVERPMIKDVVIDRSKVDESNHIMEKGVLVQNKHGIGSVDMGKIQSGKDQKKTFYKGNGKLDENLETAVKSSEIIFKKKKKEIDEVDQSKTVRVEDKKRSGSGRSIISVGERGMNRDENISMTKMKMTVKCTKSSESMNKQGRKISAKLNHIPPNNNVKNIGKNASAAITKLKGNRTATTTTTTTTTSSTSKDDTMKSDRMMIRKELMTKSPIFGEKNIEHLKQKHANTGNVEERKQKISLAKMSKVTSKLIEKIPSQKCANSTNSSVKSEEKLNKKNYRSEDEIINYHRKIGNEMRNDGMKKVGCVNFEPLIWTESLMPVYEQIWENFEFATKINDNKIVDVMFEETVEEKMDGEIVGNLENDDPEEIWTDSKLMISGLLGSGGSNRFEREQIVESSDSSKTRESEKIDAEEKIERNSGECEIDLVLNKPCKATEIKSLICLEQNIRGIIDDERIEGDARVNFGNFDRNINEVMVPVVKAKSVKTEDEKEVVFVGGTDEIITVKGLSTSAEEMQTNLKSFEMEEYAIKFDRNIFSQESGDTKKTTSALGGLGFQQQQQHQTGPEQETNDNLRRKSRNNRGQRKGQFGVMYSDISEECFPNVSVNKHSNNRKQIVGKQNYSPKKFNESSAKIENHRDPLKQQESIDIRNGRNKNFPSQQGQKKRNKRFKKMAMLPIRCSSSI